MSKISAVLAKPSATCAKKEDTMSEHNTDDWMYPPNHDGDLQVHIDGHENMALSFVGRPDYGTVELCVFDTEEMQAVDTVFECKKEHFEMLLEQASGALMNAEGDFPQRPEMEEQYE